MNTTDKTTRFRIPVDAEAAMLLLCRLAAACRWIHAAISRLQGLVRVRILRIGLILWACQQFNDVTSAASEVRISEGPDKRGADNRGRTVYSFAEQGPLLGRGTRS